MEAVAEAEMRNGASSVVSPLVRPSPSVRAMFGGGGGRRKEGRKKGGEPRQPRPDEENRASECLWEGIDEGEGERLGKSTAEMHSFVPRIEGRRRRTRATPAE